MSARRRVALVGAGSMIAASVALIAPAAYAEAPVNDNWDAATDVTAIPFEDALDTTEATTDAVQPPEMGGFKHNTVWYHLNLSADRTVVVTTEGTDYYNKVSLYEADSATQTPDGWTHLKGDRGDEGYPAGISLSLEADHDYYIVIGARKSEPGGNAQLTVRNPAHVTFKLLHAKVDPIDGSALLRGTIATDLPVVGSLSMELRQVAGDWVASGGAYTRLSVSPGDASAWHMRLTTEHPFHPGRARVLNARLRLYDSGARLHLGQLVPRVVVLR